VAIRVVRLGTRRAAGEGPRLGTVRRPPRGVSRHDFSRRDYFDVWLPELAPSPALFSWGRSQPLTDRRWATYARRYRAEMRKPSPQRLLAVLALLSRRTDFAVGCYCEDESRCHRSILRDLLSEHGAALA
jgi:uncharacterized protein YeaO (DUF488 family)